MAEYTISATYRIVPDDFLLDITPRLTEEDYKRAKAQNFRWWRGSKVFCVKWSPIVEDLIREWDPTCEPDEDDSLDDVEGRVSRFSGYAENAQASHDSAMRRAHANDDIPLGQPIFAGKKGNWHRTSIKRSQAALESAIKEGKRAEYWNRRIQGAIANAEHKERPDVIKRRIDKLQAELRKHVREGDPKHMFKYGAYDYEKGRDMTPDEISEAITRNVAYHGRWVAHLEQVIEFQQALYAVSGGVLADTTTFQVGDWVEIRFGMFRVEKVNPKTLSVMQYRDISWPLKVGREEIQQRFPVGSEQADALERAKDVQQEHNQQIREMQKRQQAEIEERRAAEKAKQIQEGARGD